MCEHVCPLNSTSFLFRMFGGVAIDSYWMAFFTSLLTFSIRLYQRKNEAQVCIYVCDGV